MLSQLLEPIALLASQLSEQIAHLCRPHPSASLGAAMASWSQLPGTAQRCSEALPCPWLPCHGTVVDCHTPSTPEKSLSAERPLSSSLLLNSGWPSSRHLRCPPLSYFAYVSVALPPRSSSPAALLSWLASSSSWNADVGLPIRPHSAASILPPHISTL